MSRENDEANCDDLDLSPETLKQWESELDYFVTGAMQRLSNLSGIPFESSRMVPGKQSIDSDEKTLADIGGDPEALQLLQSIRELTQSSADNFRQENL